MMSAQELKLTINSLLDKVNDKDVLDSILGFLLNRQVTVNDSIVAHTTDGEALTSELYKNKIDEADARIEAGEFIPHDELYNADWE